MILPREAVGSAQHAKNDNESRMKIRRGPLIRAGFFVPEPYKIRDFAAGDLDLNHRRACGTIMQYDLEEEQAANGIGIRY